MCFQIFFVEEKHEIFCWSKKIVLLIVPCVGTYTAGWYKYQLKRLETSHPNPLGGHMETTLISSSRKFKFPFISTNENLSWVIITYEGRSPKFVIFPSKTRLPSSCSLSPFSSSTYSHSPKLLHLASSCPNLQLFLLLIIKKPEYKPKHSFLES